MNTKKLTIQINLDSIGMRLMLFTVLVVILGGSTALARENSSLERAQVAIGFQARKYYLTEASFVGNQVLTACAAGYHTASLWEILDPSNLVYDTSLGYRYIPGDGTPPTGVSGWARTGNVPSIGNGAGNGNCGLWSFAAADHYGTLIELPDDWTAPGSSMGVWLTGYAECTEAYRVWCAGN